MDDRGLREAVRDRGTQEAVRVHDLTRKFGDFVAVDRAGFDVREGEIFGFLGPNGAGKTTTLRPHAYRCPPPHLRGGMGGGP